jgi:hypothetical protein
MPITMEQAFTRATAALNPVADRYNALSNRLVAANREIAALQSINEYALLGEKDPKKIEKLKTDFEEKRKNILRYYYLNEANLKELNDPGSSLSGYCNPLRNPLRNLRRLQIKYPLPRQMVKLSISQPKKRRINLRVKLQVENKRGCCGL